MNRHRGLSRLYGLGKLDKTIGSAHLIECSVASREHQSFHTIVFGYISRRLSVKRPSRGINAQPRNRSAAMVTRTVGAPGVHEGGASNLPPVDEVWFQLVALVDQFHSELHIFLFLLAISTAFIAWRFRRKIDGLISNALGTKATSDDRSAQKFPHNTAKISCSLQIRQVTKKARCRLSYECEAYHLDAITQTSIEEVTVEVTLHHDDR